MLLQPDADQDNEERWAEWRRKPEDLQELFLASGLAMVPGSKASAESKD